MPKATTSFVIRSRRYGFLHRGGFSRDEDVATIFPSLAAARNAARAAAKLYGVMVEVVRATRHSWRDMRDEQNARTLANRPVLDGFIAEYQASGALILNEPQGRKYTY